MKITITIDSNPIGGTKTTVSIDDGSEPVVTTGEPLPIAIAAQDLPAGAAVELRTPIKPDPPRPKVHNPTRPIARVEKTCAGCGDTFVAEGKSIARAKFCSNCRAGGKPANASTASGSEPVLAGPTTSKHTKACTKCGDDMPATSMYTECANCRPPKDKSKVKPCKLCTKLGKPCKRHRDGPVRITRGPAQQYPATPSADETPHLDDTKPQPQFLPGYEKSPEEIEKLRTSFPLPGAMPTGSLRHTEKSSDDFADPWDCQKCRDHMHTCDFHAGMEADGKTPPKQGSRAPISNNQF